MGTMLKAKCSHCGFERDFSFGAGMIDFTYNASVPAIDTETGKFVVKNILDPENLTGRYDFYNDPKMYTEEDRKHCLQWGDVRMQYQGNRCPACGRYELAFIEAGLFD